MFGTIFATKPTFGGKQFGKINQKLERQLFICQFWKWGIPKVKGWNPIVVTYILRLNTPPPPSSPRWG